MIQPSLRPRPVGRIARLAARALGAASIAAALTASAAEPLRLRVVGGLAGVNQYTRHEAPFWTQELARLSAGAVTADIVPFDQAGIRGQDMLRLIQVGTIGMGTALLARSQTLDAELAASDLPGMNPDFASLRRTTQAFRPYLERVLRERHGVELLAVYTYPAQVIFCKHALASLGDLGGRRVRTSSAPQSDFLRALGAVPVTTEFAEIVPAIKAGSVDCAVTGSMSGNTIGLHEVTSHVATLPVSWGLSVFVANRAVWQALPPSLRELLRRELPRVERAIWEESDHETDEGLACNVGAPGCRHGRMGHMTQVGTSVQQEQRVRELLSQAVLPAWLRRCGPSCATSWNQHLAPVVGMRAVVAP